MSDQEARFPPVDCPWPGPKPYEENEWKYYFGRDRECDSILNCIESYSLTAILSRSGFGKTSLLRAGVVPNWREHRQYGPDEYGPVFVLRDWGERVFVLRDWGASNGANRLALVMALRDDIDRQLAVLDGESDTRYVFSNQQHCDDLMSFREIPACTVERKLLTGEYLLPALASISEKCGAPPLLICDQLEELLGSGRSPNAESEDDAKTLFEAFGDIADLVPGIRIVLCLRSEYHDHLRPLGKMLPGMSKREYHLEPLPGSTVEEVITESAATAKLTIRGKPVSILLDWVLSASRHVAAQSGSGDQAQLLFLQAVLWSLFRLLEQAGRSALGEADGDGNHEITDEWLKEVFAPHLVPGYCPDSPDAKTAGPLLVTQAIHSFIDQAVPSMPISIGDLMKADAPPPSGLIRRQAARMAEAFGGPGGFKRHLRATDLVFDTVADELVTLSGGSFSNAATSALREMLSSVDYQGVEGLYKDLDAEMAARRADSHVRELYGRSGLARSADKLLGEAARWIVQASFMALDSLADPQANILKATRGLSTQEGETVYELVHDGLGIPLAQWGRMEKEEVGHALASVVATQGWNYPWHELSPDDGKRRSITGVCWRGCYFYGARFQSIDFHDCDLRGCVFNHCMLVDCKRAP